MMEERRQRLAADLAVMRALEAASSILGFEAIGAAPERYMIRLRGRGLRRSTITGNLELTDEHRCEMRLPKAYPERPPDVQWLTPIVHPNISFSGLVQLDDLGLPWSEGLSLDVVCERLWDAARMAYVDWDQVINSGAQQALRSECYWQTPLDVRPLRDRAIRPIRNIVQYRRRGEPADRRQSGETSEDVLVINEQTAAPSNHEVLYIDDREDDIV